MYRNKKLDSFWGSTMPKICSISKKFQIKVVRNLISYEKVRSTYVYLPPLEWSQGAFPFLCIIRSQMYLSLEPPPCSTRCGDRHMYVLEDFFIRNSIPNNFYLNIFFNVMCMFGTIEPQSESNFPFLYITRFQTY